MTANPSDPASLLPTSPEPIPCAPAIPADAYVIWSRDHSAYWGPNRGGYRANLLYAGVYTKAEAEHIAARCHPRAGSSLKDGERSDVAMSLSDALMQTRDGEARGDVLDLFCAPPSRSGLAALQTLEAPQ